MQELLCSVVAEEDVMDTVGETTDSTDTPPTIIPPPPGFSQFSWPYEEWSVGDGQSLFMFTKDLPGWCPDYSGGLPVVVSSLPLSLIVPDSSDDSVTATMGSSRDESITPSEVVLIVPPIGEVRSGPTAELRAVSPMPLRRRSATTFCCGHQLLLGLRTWPIVALRGLRTRFIGGGWLGKARFWPSGRRMLLICLVPDVRFGMELVFHSRLIC